MPIFAQVADGRAENKKKGDPPSVHLVRRIGLAELQDKQQTGQDKFVTGQEEETRRDPQSQRSIDQNERDSQRVRRNPLKHTAQGGFPFPFLTLVHVGLWKWPAVTPPQASSSSSHREGPATSNPAKQQLQRSTGMLASQS